MVSLVSTSRVMVLPTRLLTKICTDRRVGILGIDPYIEFFCATAVSMAERKSASESLGMWQKATSEAVSMEVMLPAMWVVTQSWMFHADLIALDCQGDQVKKVVYIDRNTCGPARWPPESGAEMYLGGSSQTMKDHRCHGL